jgi:ATP-binding cassette subfamily B protein
MAGHRLRYGAAIAALVIASCFLYLAPLVVQAVIDGVILESPGDEVGTALETWIVDRLGGAEAVLAHLWWPALLVLGLTAVAGVFTYLRGRWSAQASEAIARTVRERVYDRLQHLPCRYFDTARTGDLIQRSTSDVETLRVFLANQVVEIGRAVVMLLIPIPLMLAIHVGMTLASVVLIPPIVAFSIVYFMKVKSTFRAVDEAEGRMTTTIQENLTGIRVVRAFARQDHERARLAERNVAHRDLDYRLYVLMARYWSLSDLMCFMQKLIVVGAGLWWLAAGELRVGAFYYFLTAVTMFIWPVRMMGRILTDLGKAVVALGRLREILDERPEGDGETVVAGPAALEGRIEFEGVTFAHGESSPVLTDVSFTVEPGQTLALLGSSGAGKTTIVSLVLRLYDYDAGSIRLDGHELRTLDRRLVRGRTSTVLQDPFLYSRSLRENIALARPSAAQEEIEEATSTACIHDSILEFEAGYDTVVGERGVTLSGGQRQRVALARALLRQPAILVLDDALSAVDTGTETLILDALRRRHGVHTTIVIAHRLSTLMHADRIVVLDGGRVVQSGRHADLVGQPGLYRRLWELQSGGAEAAADDVVEARSPDPP